MIFDLRNSLATYIGQRHGFSWDRQLSLWCGEIHNYPQNTHGLWKRKNFYGKCRANGMLGWHREYLSSFNNFFQKKFETTFYIKTSIKIKKHFYFSSPSSLKTLHYIRFFPLTLWVLVQPQFRSVRGATALWGRTSISVEMMMLESNFQSSLNFFFIGSLNGLLYSFAVGPSIRYLFCWHVNALLSKINHTASSQAGCHLR